jgi:phosphoserine phosphatase
VSDLQTILIQVSGPDEPGISAGVLAVLHRVKAQVLDIEQVVIRRRLTLGLLVAVPPNQDALKELLLYGWESGLTVDFEVVEDEPTERPPGHVVTVVGPELTPAELLAATTAIAAGGGNIDRIHRLSTYPVMSYELVVLGGDPARIRESLVEAAARFPGLDVALQPEGLTRQAKRLVVLDVDSTLIQQEVIDLLAHEAGTGDEVAAITAKAMEGHLDFESSLRQRVALLKGLDNAAIERARAKLVLTPGARTFMRTLHRLGFITAVVSGGFTVFTDELQRDLQIHHARANQLEIIDGVLTGQLVGPIIDREAKAEFLREVADLEGIELDQTVAVGDGANDLDMLQLAGHGVAFNAKPVVREAADTALTVPYLDAVLFLLGIRRQDIEAADGLHDD